MPTITNATIRVGTRGSALAMRQTGIVVDALHGFHSDLNFELVEISSQGDRDRTSSIEKLGVGVFVKALEDAIEEDRVDFVVHSLKDMPSEVRDGFEIVAITSREDPREALVNRWNVPFTDLPEGARIGTGSPRRTAQLLSVRPDIEIKPMRGNVTTRLTKALAGGDSDYDGAVLAAAGMARLGRLEESSELLDANIFVPAAGQGSLAIEVKAGNRDLRDVLKVVDDGGAHSVSDAERAFMTELGAGCSAPVGAYGRHEGGSIVLSGFVSDLSGKTTLRRALAGDASSPGELGKSLASEMISDGAAEILAGIAGG